MSGPQTTGRGDVEGEATNPGRGHIRAVTPTTPGERIALARALVAHRVTGKNRDAILHALDGWPIEDIVAAEMAVDD
jgi:hypothetical protein